MFEVNNKTTKTPELYCELRTYFTPRSNLSFFNFEQEYFEQVNAT